MTGPRRWLILAWLGLLVQAISGCAETSAPSPGAGQPFPLDALRQLPRLNGGTPELAGRTLLINFWATWCLPCRREMPELQRLSTALDPQRYAVVGVAVDDDGNLAREFMLRYGIGFVNYQDAGREFASRRLGIETFPQTFIVSPRGIVTQRIGEAIAWDRFPGEQPPTPAGAKAPAAPESAT